MASKIYVDCGVEYQLDWLNIDGLGMATAKGRGNGFCDDYQLPNDGQSEHILVKRVFERLDPERRVKFLADVEQTLRPGGIINLIVAKHDEALEMVKGGAHYQQILFGPMPYSHHMMKYTFEEVARIVEQHGLIFAGESDATPDYPSFGLSFYKPHPLAARDYAMDPAFRAILKDKKVLEIGPGRFPLEGCAAYVDINKDFLEQFPPEKRHLANLEDGLPFKDKEFDFVYCAHVLEHTEDPVKAAKEICRVGKFGLVIMPSAYKEFLFGYEEKDHLWEIFPPNAPGQPILFRGRNPELVNVFDKDYQSSMCSLFRAGRYDLHERKVLRKWYREHEVKLDVIVAWQDSFEVKVI